MQSSMSIKAVDNWHGPGCLLNDDDIYTHSTGEQARQRSIVLCGQCSHRVCAFAMTLPLPEHVKSIINIDPDVTKPMLNVSTRLGEEFEGVDNSDNSSTDTMYQRSTIM